MAKVKISDFSSTAGNNTEIDNINISEGCAPSGINNAIRELMAQLKDFQTGAAGDSFNGPVGTTTAAAGAFTTLSASGAFTYGGVTLSNAVTGTGNMVLSASPTLTGTLSGANASLSGTLAVTGVATLTAQPILSSLTASRAVFTDGSKGLVSNAITGTGNVVMSASPTLTGTISAEALTTSSTVTHNGGTANGVAYLNGSKVLTTGSALTFASGNFLVNGAASGSALSGDASVAAIRDSTTANVASYKVIGGSSNTQIELFGSSSTTGLWTSTNTPMLFAVNNAEQMRLTSTGLGIGTSSPTDRLHVVGTASRFDKSNGVAVGQIRLLTATDSYASAWALGQPASSTNFAVQYFNGSSWSDAVTVNTSGNLGLGVTPSAWGGSGVKAFDVGTGASFAGSGGDAGMIANAYYNGSNWIYKTSSLAVRYQQLIGSGVHAWFTAPAGTAGDAISFTQAMSLTAGGDLLVGTTSTIAGARMSVVGNVQDTLVRLQNQNATAPGGLDVHYSGAATNNADNWFYLARDSGATRFYVQSNGGIANFSANNSNLSDRREKTNFAPAKSYLETICAIPVQTFNYIDQNLEEDAGLTLGVVAQDVQAVAPELVMESNWGTKDEPKMRLSVYQTDLQYALMKALQELKTEFDAYKAAHP